MALFRRGRRRARLLQPASQHLRGADLDHRLLHPRRQLPAPGALGGDVAAQRRDALAGRPHQDLHAHQWHRAVPPRRDQGPLRQPGRGDLPGGTSRVLEPLGDQRPARAQPLRRLQDGQRYGGRLEGDAGGLRRLHPDLRLRLHQHHDLALLPRRGSGEPGRDAVDGGGRPAEHGDGGLGRLQVHLQHVQHDLRRSAPGQPPGDAGEDDPADAGPDRVDLSEVHLPGARPRLRPGRPGHLAHRGHRGGDQAGPQHLRRLRDVGRDRLPVELYDGGAGQLPDDHRAAADRRQGGPLLQPERGPGPERNLERLAVRTADRPEPGRRRQPRPRPLARDLRRRDQGAHRLPALRARRAAVLHLRAGRLVQHQPPGGERQDRVRHRRRPLRRGHLLGLRWPRPLPPGGHLRQLRLRQRAHHLRRLQSGARHLFPDRRQRRWQRLVQHVADEPKLGARNGAVAHRDRGHDGEERLLLRPREPERHDRPADAQAGDEGHLTGRQRPGDPLHVERRQRHQGAVLRWRQGPDRDDG